jgi:hypothetical protein
VRLKIRGVVKNDGKSVVKRARHIVDRFAFVKPKTIERAAFIFQTRKSFVEGGSMGKKAKKQAAQAAQEANGADAAAPAAADVPADQEKRLSGNWQGTNHPSDSSTSTPKRNPTRWGLDSSNLHHTE